MKTIINHRQIGQYAGLLKRLGYSAAFGKIFGYLITAHPPCRTFEEIVTDLRLSKGAVSMVLRIMEQHGYVEYFYKTGDRKRYFRVSMKKWKQGIERKIEDSIEFTELLRESLGSVSRADLDHRNTILKFIKLEELTQLKMREIISLFSPIQERKHHD
ncbi:MAG: ArsR family transcriptional regulator [Planctomycetia bacterium]|nr:ArsR family transcriptional regulator [Planctomycetia bacterium]